MNNKLIFSLCSAAAVGSLAGHAAQATENPFAMQKINHATQLAEAATKTSEGKCGEGKCGDNKMKERSCSGAMDKVKEGKCGSDKMKDDGCNDHIGEPVSK